VLAKLYGEAKLLICETCLDTGTRISEVTGLMVKHVDLEKGTIQIAQRNWRMDIDAPKTEKGKRVLALGALLPRYKGWIAGLKYHGPEGYSRRRKTPRSPGGTPACGRHLRTRRAL
jgi:integrase